MWLLGVQTNLGTTPGQRAEVRRLRDEHLAKLYSLQQARQQLTANVAAGAKANNNVQVCWPLPCQVPGC